MWVARLEPTDHDAVLELARAADTVVEREELARECARVWVARAEPSGPVVGFLLAWLVADEVHLINIVTAPNARRQGVGKSLVTALMDLAAEVRARLVVLEVRRSNTPAIRLYRRAGFCAIGVRRGYYSETREDAIEMLATLDPESGQIQPGRDEIHLSA